MLRIEIETDNAAFADDMAGEISRVLGRISVYVSNLVGARALDGSGQVRDSNGNVVGRWEYKS